MLSAATTGIGRTRAHCAPCFNRRRRAKRYGEEPEESHDERMARITRIALLLPCPKHGSRSCHRAAGRPACSERIRAAHEQARAYAEGTL